MTYRTIGVKLVGIARYGFLCESGYCEWHGIGSVCDPASPNCMSVSGREGVVCSHDMCVYTEDTCDESNKFCYADDKYITSTCCKGLACVDVGEEEGRGRCFPCYSDWWDCVAQRFCCRGYTCNHTTRKYKLCSLGANCDSDTDCTGFGCENLMCFGGLCTSCTAEDAKCGEGIPDCCSGLTCFTGDSTTSTCQPCTAKDAKCVDDVLDCCTGSSCYHGACAQSSGALSLFNMNFSLKQLVGFAVVMVATGLL